MLGSVVEAAAPWAPEATVVVTGVVNPAMKPLGARKPKYRIMSRAPMTIRTRRITSGVRPLDAEWGVGWGVG